MSSNGKQFPANDLQENPNAIPEGETPHNVTLLCYDPLVDVTKPGDRITVTGVLHWQCRPQEPLHMRLQRGSQHTDLRLWSSLRLLSVSGWQETSRAQSSACPRAGIYRAHGLRVNPRLRMLKTVYKANVDIIHVQRDETSSLFSVSERLSAGADSQPESQPDDPMGIDSVRPSRKGPLYRNSYIPSAF